MLRLSVHWEKPERGQFVLIVRGFKSHPSEWVEKGIGLRTAVARRWTLKAQDPQIKASQFMSGVLAILAAPSGERQELLFFGSGGTVAEGATSNIFIVRDKRLLTPSVSSGILRGVTRNIVMELARGKGIETLETFLTRHDVYNAQECFLTNTSSEVLPVIRVDGRMIGSGRPGPVTKMLAEEFKRAIGKD